MNTTDQHAQASRLIIVFLGAIALAALALYGTLEVLHRPVDSALIALVSGILGMFGGVLQLPQRAATGLASAVQAVSTALQPVQTSVAAVVAQGSAEQQEAAATLTSGDGADHAE